MINSLDKKIIYSLFSIFLIYTVKTRPSGGDTSRSICPLKEGWYCPKGRLKVAGSCGGGECDRDAQKHPPPPHTHILWAIRQMRLIRGWNNREAAVVGRFRGERVIWNGWLLYVRMRLMELYVRQWVPAHSNNITLSISAPSLPTSELLSSNIRLSL